MKLWEKLFGSEKIVDGVIKGTDKVFFTNEEKMDWYLKYLEATAPQNLARRYIAIIVTFTWCYMAIIAGMLTAFGVKTAADMVEYVVQVISEPFLWIIGFYFLKRIADTVSKR